MGNSSVSGVAYDSGHVSNDTVMGRTVLIERGKQLAYTLKSARKTNYNL